jgi:hypothetical protein
MNLDFGVEYHLASLGLVQTAWLCETRGLYGIGKI